jgi:hypothetical protein
MKVPPTTVIRFANLPSLVFPGKNKVGCFLDRPRIPLEGRRNEVHCVPTQKFVLLSVTAVRTSNPTNLFSYDTVSSTDATAVASMYHRLPHYVNIHDFRSLSSLAFR